MMRTDRRSGERGQLLAFFAIALVAITGTVGIVIDGGTTFVQRREQQNVADAAAMAAGYARVNGADPSTAALSLAAANGYVSGVNSTVSVGVGASTVTVTVTKPHPNAFAGVLGFASWDVGATATVTTGTPNVAYGALPVIFNQKAFDDPANRIPNSPVFFGEPGTGTNDIPLDANTFNWTVFCMANGAACNGDSSTVDSLIVADGDQVALDLTTQIGPLNAGAHTTLFSDLSEHIGGTYPVAIVDDSGALLGWATLHLTGSVGGTTKSITGWFDTSANSGDLTVTPNGGTPTRSFGQYSVKLTN